MNLFPYGQCIDCGSPLTIDEEYYLEYRCSECEFKFNERIRVWRNGADDKELDEMYGTPERVTH